MNCENCLYCVTTHERNRPYLNCSHKHGQRNIDRYIVCNCDYFKPISNFDVEEFKRVLRSWMDACDKDEKLDREYSLLYDILIRINNGVFNKKET